MAPIKIRISQWSGLLLFLVIGSLVGAGVVAFVVYGGPTMFGWAYFGFGGVLLLVSVLKMLDKRSRIVIDDTGVDDRNLGIGVIRWNDISEAFLLRDEGQTNKFYMGLELRNPKPYLERMSKYGRATAAWDRLLGYTEFSIDVSGLDQRPQVILDCVLQRISATDLEERPV